MNWTDAVVREVLPNGLTVLVQHDPAASTVAVVTHVRAGYFDEPDEWVGIAHVVEHMFFKGTPQRGPGVLAQETQRLGGYVNAGTIYDKTVYYTVVPAVPGAIEGAVGLQADALRNAALPEDELVREIEVIVQEAKRKLDTPDAVTGETLYELLFRVHPMRRWRIGTEAGLRALTADDVRTYYHSRYTPARTIIALAGNLDVDAALVLARRAYGDWAASDAPVPPPPEEPDDRHADVRVLRGDVERPLVALGWRTRGPLHPDEPALNVAALILGAGRTSWLWQAVRKPGLGSGVDCAHYTPLDVGVFQMSFSTDPATVDRAVRRAVVLTSALAGDGPDDGALERAKALFATQWAARFESADGRASTLAEFEALGDVGRADAYYAAVMEVDAAAVRRVADQYLQPDHGCGVVYLPEHVSEPAIARGWPVEIGADAVAPSPILDSVRHPGADGTGAETVEVGPGVFHVRASGADLLIRSKRGTPLVALGVHFPGMRATESRDTAGISWLLTRSALRGASGMNGEQLAAAAERLGGAIRPAVGAETLGWVVTVRSEAARGAVALLRDVAAGPTLEIDEVEVERALQVDDAARFRDDMFRYPLHSALQEAFPNDAYGLPALGDPETLRALDLGLLAAWGGRLRGARPVVVAVGDLDVAGLRDAAEAFADWPGAPDRIGPAAVPPAWSPGRGEERREKAQTAVAMAFPTGAAASDDRFAGSVVSALLSGLAGRLFDELRERRALAYTVHAQPWLRPRAGALLAYIATSPEREDEAREAMLGELRKLSAAAVSTDELERACNYAAGLVAIRRQHVRALAVEIADGWLSGTIAEFGDVERRLRAVDQREIAEFATRVFDPEQRAEYVVRGAGKSL